MPAEKPTFDRHADRPEYTLSDVGGGAIATIGRSASKDTATFQAAKRASKWGGECWLDVTAEGVTPDIFDERLKKYKAKDCLEAQFVRDHGSKKKRGEIHRWYPGSVEWEIEWASRDDAPAAAGYVDFLLDFSAGLEWHKQIALTPEETAAGCVRPENVLNSYAVYWPRSGRILRADGTERVNYETGKFTHLYRPQLIDADGQTLWCDQLVMQDGQPRLRVYLDAEWLAAARYPVILDPTFGYTSVGATTGGISAGQMNVYGPHTPASSGSAASVSLYRLYESGFTGTAYLTLGLYAESGGTAASLLKDSGDTITTTTNVWVTANLDSALAVVGGTNYWFGAHGGGSNIRHPYDAAAGFKRRYNSATYVGGTLANPYPGGTLLDGYKYSIYATYTEPPAGNPHYAYAQQ